MYLEYGAIARRHLVKRATPRNTEERQALKRISNFDREDPKGSPAADLAVWLEG
jgi:hypothetical protein